MRLTFIISFLLLAVFSVNVSCKKKDKTPHSTGGCDTTFVHNYINDTIFPSEYLMTYPGSEWNYDNGTTVTCDAWENVAFAAPTTNDDCVTVTKDHHFLPHCSSEPIYLSANMEVFIDNPDRTEYLQIIDTTVGVFWEDSYVEYYGQTPYWSVSRSMEVIEKLESMEVLSVTYQDVIHVRKKIIKYAIGGIGSHPYAYDYYFAKNIGLIKYVYDPYDAPVTTKNLVSYTIGPH